MKKINLLFLILIYINQIAQAQWSTNGSNIYNSNSGNVGIGTASPTSTLHVAGTGLFSGSVTLGGTFVTSAGASIGNNLFISTDGTGYGGIYLFRDGVYNQSGGVFLRYRDEVRAPGGLHNIELGVNGVPVLAINNAYQVGIGTETPSNLLHLYAANSGSPLLNIQNGATSGYNQITYTGTSATFNTGLGNGSETTWGVPNSYYIFDATNNAMRFVVKPSGYIGIGTTNPNGFLHISGNATSTSLLNLQGTASTGYAALAYTGTGISFGEGVGNASETGLGVANSWFLYDVTHSALRMMVNSTGNVLIGEKTQKNSSYLLDVNGAVRSNSVTVNVSGADFVFENNYKLPSLIEVENYLNINHHLPGIAPAKEMQAEGLNLGDNQIKQLQKIEELTLYLIQKEKEIKEQNSKINEQQKEIENLKQREELQDSKIKSLEDKMLQIITNR